MSEQTTTTAPDEGGKDFTAQAVESQIASMARDLVAEATGDLQRELKELQKPDRSRLPSQASMQKQDEAIARVAGGVEVTDVLYRSLPGVYDNDRTRKEEVRAFRGREVDELVANYFRCLANRRPDLAERYRQEADDLLLSRSSIARATLEVGAVDPGDGTSIGGGVGLGTGADLVPVSVHGQLDLFMQPMRKFRQISRTITTPNKQVRLPVGAAATALMFDDDSTVNLTDGTPNPTTVLADKKNQYCLVVSTNDMLEDSPFNVVNWLTFEAGEAMALQENEQFSGVNSIINRPISDTTAFQGPGDITGVPDNTALSYSRVVETYFGCPESVRPIGVWLCNGFVLQYLSQLEMPSSGSGVSLAFSPVGSPGTPVDPANPAAVGTLYGRPVIEVPMAGTAGVPTAGQNKLIYGPMSRHYTVVDGGAITVARADDTYFVNDQVAWRFKTRFTGTNTRPDVFSFVAGIGDVA